LLRYNFTYNRKAAMDIKSGFEDNVVNQQDGDKRADKRVPVPLIPVKVGEQPEALSCVMLNISRSGALIQAPKSLEEQSFIKTNFLLPNTETAVDCRSRVIWSRNVYKIHARMGIKFDDMSSSAADEIGGYVQNQIAPRPERRKKSEPRVPAPYLSVTIADGHGHSRGVILDISRSGLLIQTAKKKNAGSVVRAEFILPGSGKTVKCLARVAWRKNLYGVLANEGLEFIDINAESLKRIDEFVGKQALPRA